MHMVRTAYRALKKFEKQNRHNNRVDKEREFRFTMKPCVKVQPYSRPITSTLSHQSIPHIASIDHEEDFIRSSLRGGQTSNLIPFKPSSTPKVESKDSPPKLVSKTLRDSLEGRIQLISPRSAKNVHFV